MFKQSLSGIDKLIIYGNGEKLLEKNRDFNKIGKLENGSYHDSYFDRILSINLNQETKQARKENLNRKDNYFLSFKKDYSRQPGTALYLHFSEVSVKNLGEFLAMDTHDEKCFLYAFQIRFLNGAEAELYHIEKMNVPGNWTPPAGYDFAGYGCKTPENCYEIVSEEQQKHNKEFAEKTGRKYVPFNLLHKWYTNETITETVLTSEGYHKYIKSPERENRENLAAVMNTVLYNKISHYDIEKLLQVVNITIK